MFFLDVFSIRQNVKDDFEPDHVETLIQAIGTTLMVAHPWNNPDTLKRIWCVFEVLCTIQSGAQLEVTIARSNDLMKMNANTHMHEDIFDSVLDSMKNIKVEKAKARSESDREKIMSLIKAGPGFLKTNLEVASALTKAIAEELSQARAKCRISLAIRSGSDLQQATPRKTGAIREVSL